MQPEVMFFYWAGVIFNVIPLIFCIVCSIECGLSIVLDILTWLRAVQKEGSKVSSTTPSFTSESSD